MTTSQSFKPSEGKREEFRKYLEKTGIMDALTKVLVNIYEEPEKPEDALKYIIEKLCIQLGLETHQQLNAKLNEVNAYVKELEDEIDGLKAKIKETEGGPGAQSTHSAHPEDGTGEEGEENT